jgi:hypothetical protein
MRLHVIDGNDKLGRISNLSLPPRATCNQCAGCVEKGCYAWKLFQHRPSVHTAWLDNWKLWKADPKRFEGDLAKHLSNPRITHFRWHVGGDIPSAEYWQMMIRIARQFHKIDFLAFSKQFDIIRGRIPGNLEVVISAWPDLPIPRRVRRRFRVAWMFDKNNPDKRIPKSAVECSGHCDKCHMCWDLRGSGKDVVFHKH